LACCAALHSPEELQRRQEGTERGGKRDPALPWKLRGLGWVKVVEAVFWLTAHKAMTQC